MKRTYLALTLGAALCACGHRNTTTTDSTGGTVVTQVDRQGGTTTTHVAGADLTPIPTDLPKWGPAYPGAKVATVMVQNDNGVSTKAVVLTTSDDMKTVVAFYNAKIGAAGITPTMAQDSPEGSVRVIETASGAKSTLMIGRSDDATSITLSYGTKK